MTIASEIERIQKAVANAYSSCSAKGATLPEKQNTDNLPATIDSIKKESGPLSKYEIVDGVAQTTSKKLTGDEFADIKEIDDYGLYYAFYQCSGLTGSVSFPKLTSVEGYGLYNAFYQCEGLTGSVNFPNLTSVGNRGLWDAFFGCKGLTGSVNFPKLTSIADYGLYYAFYQCEGLTGSVNFPKLTSVGGYGLRYAFYQCSELTSVNFSNLTSVGDYGLYNAFYDIPNITIHFRKDMESTISSQSGYPKFGASNATVLFDL